MKLSTFWITFRNQQTNNLDFHTQVVHYLSHNNRKFLKPKYFIWKTKKLPKFYKNENVQTRVSYIKVEWQLSSLSITYINTLKNIYKILGNWS